MQKPVRLPRLGHWLKVGGSGLALISYSTCRLAGRAHPVIALCCLATVALGGVLAVVGEMLKAPDADALLKEDNRKSIIFFRPFSRDKSLFWFRMYRRIFGYGGYFQGVYTAEEILADIFGRFGPFVALGRPGEMITTPGAARAYLDNDQWKSCVKTWLKRARVVIFHVGDGESLRWEFEATLRECGYQAIILYVPPKNENKDRERQYERFRADIGGKLPFDLPEKIGTSIFIKMNVSGAQMLPFSRLSMRQYIPIALKSRQYKSFIEVVVSLLPVLEEFDGKIEMPGVDLKMLAAQLQSSRAL